MNIHMCIFFHHALMFGCNCKQEWSFQIHGFKNSAMACKRKFNTLYMQYREDKVANNILGNDHHDCKFYESLDT
jgi:hypothetical protein